MMELFLYILVSLFVVAATAFTVVATIWLFHDIGK